jgi:hypothetical protein
MKTLNLTKEFATKEELIEFLDGLIEDLSTSKPLDWQKRKNNIYLLYRIVKCIKSEDHQISEQLIEQVSTV